MAWDDDKSTASDPDNPTAAEQLTAAEWNDHVADGHWPSDEFNQGVDGNGDPVITDPKNGDAVVMRYDRSAGEWVLPAVNTEQAVIDELDVPPVQPHATIDHGQRAIQPPEWDISIVNSEFRLSTLTNVDTLVNEPEGMAYQDGNIYIGEDTRGGGAATIYELDTDGNTTGDSMTLPQSSDDHTNSMEWYDGHLWVGIAAASSARTLIIDWENKNVVDTISHDGDIASELWRCLIPTTDGGAKLLYTEYVGSGAHLVDADAARTDGTTSGNIDRTLTQGLWNNLQAAQWRNGYLYWASHNGVVKARYPFGDQIDEGFPVSTGQGIEWHLGSESSFDSLEDFAYNPDDDVWYIGESNNGGTAAQRIYSAVEHYGERIPPSWDQGWEIVDRGTKYPRSLKLDSAVQNGGHQYRMTERALAGRLEMWFYDDGASNKKTFLKVADGSGVVTMGVNTGGVTATNYFWNSATNTETDTGVARPSGDWVVFAWTGTGNSMKLQISTDYGTTWTDVATVTGDSTHAQLLSLQISWESVETTGVWGHGTFTPFYG